MLVYLLGQSVHASTTESLVIVVAAAAAGALSHARQGAVCWKLASAARRLPQQALARGFTLLLAGIALYLLGSVAFFGTPPHG